MTLKHVIGNGAPVSLVAEAAMQDILIPSSQSYRRELSSNRTVAVVVIDGQGTLSDEASSERHDLQSRYFAVVHAGTDGSVAIEAGQSFPLRLGMIEVPAVVKYALYREQHHAY